MFKTKIKILNLLSKKFVNNLKKTKENFEEEKFFFEQNEKSLYTTIPYCNQHTYTHTYTELHILIHKLTYSHINIYY